MYPIAVYRNGCKFDQRGVANHQAFIRETVKARHEDAWQMLSDGVTFLRRALEARADRDYLRDTARGLHDAVSDLIGGMQRDLDEEHMDYDWVSLDMAELDLLIERLG
jgi:hypothetical protein